MSLVIIMGGCQSSTREKESRTQVKVVKPSVEIETFTPSVDAVTRDFSTFWNYWNDHTKLAVNYIALGMAGEKMNHALFLKKLKTGKYLPVLVKKEGTMSYYKLTKLPKDVAPDISETISYTATRYYKYCQMEGRALPDFHFKDLDGRTYNRENCKGKILVLNTWFVKCAACKEEMPDLNQLVATYKDRKDIVFLGLCLDDADKIHSFLNQMAFAYHIIPDAMEYNRNGLHTSVYPTNTVVNKEGEVVKMMESNAPTLQLILEDLAAER